MLQQCPTNEIPSLRWTNFIRMIQYWRHFNSHLGAFPKYLSLSLSVLTAVILLLYINVQANFPFIQRGKMGPETAAPEN